ncbi:hypothetical protein RSW84_27370, partial [Escherichia coli]|uniref:hypothetical protein n=1 Tax=Escherichia coli TaxID=562 RepID=UPI0028DD550B
ARRLDRIQQQQALVDLVLRGPQEADPALGSGLGGGMGGGASSMFSSAMLRALSDAQHARDRKG